MAGKRMPEATAERIAHLKAELGWSDRRIADDLKISRGSVSWHCLVNGIEPPKIKGKCWENGPKGPLVVKRGDHVMRRFTQPEDAQLLAMEAESKTYAEMARALERRPNSIKGRLATLARQAERREAAQ